MQSLINSPATTFLKSIATILSRSVDHISDQLQIITYVISFNLVINFEDMITQLIQSKHIGNIYVVNLFNLSISAHDTIKNKYSIDGIEMLGHKFKYVFKLVNQNISYSDVDLCRCESIIRNLLCNIKLSLDKFCPVSYGIATKFYLSGDTMVKVIRMRPDISTSKCVYVFVQELNVLVYRKEHPRSNHISDNMVNAQYYAKNYLLSFEFIDFETFIIKLIARDPNAKFKGFGIYIQDFIFS